MAKCDYILSSTWEQLDTLAISFNLTQEILILVVFSLKQALKHFPISKAMLQCFKCLDLSVGIFWSGATKNALKQQSILKDSNVKQFITENSIHNKLIRVALPMRWFDG